MADSPPKESVATKVTEKMRKVSQSMEGAVGTAVGNVKESAADPESLFTIDRETHGRIRKVTEGVTSSLQVLANEPSLGLYRMEEHVVKAVPELVKTKQEIVKLTGIVHGACHDVEYALTTVQAMQKISSFESLQAHTEKAIEYQQKIRRMHQAANQKKQDARAGARSPDLIEPTGAFSASLRTGMTPTDNSNEDGGAPTGAVQNDAVDGEGAADGADPTDDDALVSPKKKKKKKKAKEIVTKSFS